MPADGPPEPEPEQQATAEPAPSDPEEPGSSLKSPAAPEPADAPPEPQQQPAEHAGAAAEAGEPPDAGDAEGGESEEEEEEPRLKYQRLGASVGEILAQDAAACLCVSDKFLALGTHDGTVHVLDYAGNEVRRFEVHKSRVNDISIDDSAEFLASCSDDGSAAVHGLYTDESTRYKYNKPVKTIALDPRYGRRKTREFCTGGLAGQLLLSSKGWLGTRDTVLHSGEGDVSIARWSGNLIAWANAKSVKVYDTSIHQILGLIPRPPSSVAWERVRCHLCWEAGQLLYVGWGDCVRVARLARPKAGSGSPGAADGRLAIEVLAAFQLPDCLVAGIAPFGFDIVLLTYVTEEPGSPRSADERPQQQQPQQQQQQEALRPELKFVDWRCNEKASDALSINGFEHYQASDYSLAACYPPSNSLHARAAADKPDPRDFTKWWKPGDEPQYYLVSPKDIVVGRPRDADDRLDWLLQKRRFEQALAVAAADASLPPASHAKVATAYLEHLIQAGSYQQAAALCPQLLKEDAAAWERWAYTFAQHRRLAELAPLLPTARPRLRVSAYEMVAHAFLLSPADHPRLLALLEAWPPALYGVPQLTQAVVQRIRSAGGESPALLECAARLYQAQGRFDLTLAILLRLRRPRVFAFIAGHHLLPLLKGSAVSQLLEIDEQRATRLLVDFHEEAPAQAVAPAIQAAMQEAADRGDAAAAAKWRRRLHTYLDWLFLADASAGAAFHGLQVALYAEFAPDRLMGFLVSSQSYPLEAAHELCKSKGLVREQVFVLGRMGNAREALQLIISRLADIPQAIEFVQMQQDDELWDLLIGLALADASLTGALLDHIGSHIDPLRLVRRLPEGMAVQRLRDRLVTIIADFRGQTQLRQCCAALLASDGAGLAQRLYCEVRRALPLARVFVRGLAPTGGGGGGGGEWRLASAAAKPGSEVALADLPGPCGARQLHLLPAGDGASPPEPLKVWVGFLQPAAAEQPEADAAAARKGRGRQAQARRDAAQPQLPSLLAA